MSTPLPTSAAFITRLLDSLPPLPQHSASDDGDATHVSATAQPSNPLDRAPDALKKQLLTLHVLFPNEFLPALDLLDRRLVTRFRIMREVDKGTRAHGRDAGAQVDTARDVHDTVTTATTSGAAARTPTARHYGSRKETAAPNPDIPTSATNLDIPNTEMLDSAAAAAESPNPPHPQPEPPKPPEPPTAHSIPNPSTTNTVYYVRSAQTRTSRYSTSFDSTSHYEVRLSAWNCSCPAFAFSAFPPALPEPRPAYMEDGGAGHSGSGTGWRFGGRSLGVGTPPVCKHLLACVLGDRVGLFGGYVVERRVGFEEAAAWAAGWGD